MNERLRDLAKRVDDLGETVTMAHDPVDGHTIAVLDWEAVERILDKLAHVRPAQKSHAYTTQQQHEGECKWCEQAVEFAIDQLESTGSKTCTWCVVEGRVELHGIVEYAHNGTATRD